MYLLEVIPIKPSITYFFDFTFNLLEFGLKKSTLKMLNFDLFTSKHLVNV